MPPSLLTPPYPIVLLILLSLLHLTRAQPSLSTTATFKPLQLANPTLRLPLNPLDTCRTPTCTPTCPCAYIACPASSGLLNCCDPNTESCLNTGPRMGTCCAGINQACVDRCCPTGRICGERLLPGGGGVVGNCCEAGKGACVEVNGKGGGCAGGGRCVDGCCV